MGIGIGAMFVLVALVQIRNRNRTWGGEVIDKRMEEIRRRQKRQENRFRWESIPLPLPAPKMSRGGFRLRAERWLGVLLGVVLVAGGLRTVVLKFVGESAPGVVTLVRREGGERSDVQAGRYTYVVSYTFKLPDGRTVDGFAKIIGDGAYVRRPNTVTTVRYLRHFPVLNALESETAISLTQVILIAVGVALMWPSAKETRKR